MDVNRINTNRQSTSQQKPNDVQKTSNGQNNAAKAVVAAVTNAGQSYDSVKFTEASVTLVNSKIGLMPGENRKVIDTPQQADKVVKQLAKKIQDNPGQALAAYGNLLSGHLNLLEI